MGKYDKDMQLCRTRQVAARQIERAIRGGCSSKCRLGMHKVGLFMVRVALAVLGAYTLPLWIHSTLQSSGFLDTVPTTENSALTHSKPTDTTWHVFVSLRQALLPKFLSGLLTTLWFRVGLRT